MSEQRTAWLRLASALGGLVVGVIAFIVVVVLADRTPGPVSSATPALPSAAAASSSNGNVKTSVAGFPAPPQKAIVFAREDGAFALALGLVPGKSQVRLQASVIDQQGNGQPGLHVSYSLHVGSVVTRTGAIECGAGCYTATLPLLSTPTRIDVDVAGHGATTVWRVAMPAQWPPPNATKLLERAGKTWRSLKTLVFHDHLASDPTHSVNTIWRIEAPDKVTYDILGGSSAVMIGDTRWDRLPGQPWKRSSAVPLTQPVPFWSAVADARVIGSRTIGGRDAWDVTFFDPVGPAWFEVLIDKETMRTRDLRMTTTSHFMHEQYTSFNTPVTITPPACPTC
ncbi:MAG: hypothetical protein ACYDA3_11920 [Gaiellaceae bacterium]